MTDFNYNIDKRVREYFNILEPNFPEFLYDYINTKELLKQQYISMSCGTIYSDLFESEYFYSNLDHSIGVALVVWHFTHDKKQTLSGLFHDIATPCFKHCVDFINGDYMTQESTEELTTEIIKSSKEIMNLLKRDNISIEEIDNYHLYPIADNDTPRLSADRLEYSLANSLFTYNLLTIDEVKEIYNDIEIQTNEDGVIELGFKTKKHARKLVQATSKLSIIYRDDRTIYSMQFIADILKNLNNDNLITIDDLYELKESEIIDIIKEQDNPTIAPYVSDMEVRLRISAKAESEYKAKEMITPIVKKVKDRVGGFIYSEDNVSIDDQTQRIKLCRMRRPVA